MRRADLAVTDPKQIDEIIQSCDCVRLAFADGTRPYIVPLSFGYRREGDVPVFYFHGAKEGRKVDLCRALAYAGFELDTDRQVHPNENACDFSVRYQSVVGEGEITEITLPEEKAAALQMIMEHYSGKENWEFPDHVVAKTFVARLTVKEMTGRAHG